MSSKPITFIPKRKVEDSPRGCWVTALECLIVAGAVGLVLAMVFVWSCQEIELSAVREQLTMMEGTR